MIPSRRGIYTGGAWTLTVFLSVAMLAAPAGAQDSHYWSDQWGTRANLLGGVVIGSSGDLSSTYYNPGFLALGEETSFIIATKVYELSRIEMPGFREDQVDLASTRLTAAPDFIAGEFTFGWLGESRMAYSLLTRYSTSFEIKGRIAQPAIDGSGPESTLSSGEIFSRQNITEIWGGLSYSQALGQGFGLGATFYGAYRSQRQRHVSSGARTDSTLQTESISGVSDGNFWNGRILVKLGLAWTGNNLTLGLNFTTPSLSLLGQGSYFQQIATSGVTGVDPPLDASYHSAVYEDGLDASYKTSWAVGLGGSYRFGEVRIHSSVEYYDEVGPHLVMQSSPWYPQTGGEATQADVYQELKSVLNFGVGVEIPLSETWLSYGSIILDNSGAVPADESPDTLSTSTWDIYQVSAGAEVQFSKGQVTMGLSYAFANDTVKLDNVMSEGGNPVIGEDVEVRYRRLKLLTGFSIAF